MVHTLGHRWWILALRGLAAIAFGVLTFFTPGLTLLVLVLAFGVYALADGVFDLAMAVRKGREGEPWGALAFGGVAGVAAGVITLFRPTIGAMALLILIALRAIFVGMSEIATAIRLRKVIRGEWMLGLAGLLSVAFGLALVFFPRAGALAVALWIGAFAVVYGGLLVGLAFKVRSWAKEPRHTAPTGRTPVPVA